MLMPVSWAIEPEPGISTGTDEMTLVARLILATCCTVSVLGRLRERSEYGTSKNRPDVSRVMDEQLAWSASPFALKVATILPGVPVVVPYPTIFAVAWLRVAD
jgi:hypothetical protein